MIQASEQFVDVPGGNVYVKRWSSGQNAHKVPIILLHNSLGCVDMWRDFPARLCAKLDCPVIAYDRLGFGRSSARTSLPSMRFIYDEAEIYLPRILAALAVERFIIWGHSVGGEMAVACGGHLSSRCDAVITEAAQAFVEDKTLEGIRNAQMEFKNPTALAKLEKYHGPKVDWILSAWFDIWLSDEFANWSLRDDLPKLECPLLIFYGDSDEYGSLKFPQLMADLTGGYVEKHILQDCGHNPHREQTEKVLDLAASFLSV